MRAVLPDYCSAPPEEATPHALLPAGRLVRTLGVTQTLACALGYAPSPDAQQPVSATCSAHNATAGSWTVGAQFCARMPPSLLFSDCLQPPVIAILTAILTVIYFFPLVYLYSELARM